MKRLARICALVLVASSSVARAEDAPRPTLGKVWAEQPIGNPEKPGTTGYNLSPMPESAYRFDNGEYHSVVSRIKLALPSIGDEQYVTVREAVVSRRPDGSVITSHVIFIPGSFSPIGQSESGISAVVVTRLRDDRPKDAESVFQSWQPRSDEERKLQERNGIWHERVKTPLGDALQRVVQNRTADGPFPYRTRLLKDDQVKFMGVSRFVVIDDDSFIEFSQVYPCRTLGPFQCKESALAASDRFIGGVREFLTFPKKAPQ